jgi:CheY-like chemotaxis protein
MRAAPAGSLTMSEDVTALRILVVEDEPAIAELLSEVLAGMGHEVCAVAATEGDAVAAADRCHPDLMIVDVRLAVGSGVNAVDAILRGGHVPHVFVSADIATVQALRLKSIVMQKPYREAELAWAIQRSMKGSTPGRPGT